MGRLAQTLAIMTPTPPPPPPALAPAPTKVKPNKRKAAICKLIGTAMILFAFGVQYFWHDMWKEKAETTARLIAKAQSSRQNLDRVRTFRLARTGANDAFSNYLLSFGELCEYQDCRGSNDPKYPFSFQGLVDADIAVKTRQHLEAFLTKAVSTERNLLESAERTRDDAASIQYKLKTLFTLLYLAGSLALVGGLVYEVRGASE